MKYLCCLIERKIALQNINSFLFLAIDQIHTYKIFSNIIFV